MKILFVTIGSSDNVNAGSGTPYFMSRAFAQHGAEVVRIQSLRGAKSVSLRLKEIFHAKILKRNYSTYRHKRRLRLYARQIEAHLEKIKPDIILSPSTLPIAYLRSDVPIIFWTDATFAGLLDFYSEYVKCSREAILEGNQTELAALQGCAAAIYSSEWAAKSAIDDYHVDPGKLHVVNFGANISASESDSEVLSAVGKRDLRQIELLFIGMDWPRKGGDIAVDVAVEMNRRGLPTRLRAVGPGPPKPENIPSCVELVGFVDKSTAEGLQKFRDLLSSSTFLVLPSRAECCAMVVAEANSAALPVIASDVGGMSSAIRPGINGFLVPITNRIDEVNRYADAIQSALTSPSYYSKLTRSSLQEFRDRLNWDVAAQSVMKIIENILT